MSKAIRAIVLVPPLSIAYIPISVYFYGKGRTSGGEPLSMDCWSLLWFPMVAFNAWAIASALSQDEIRGSDWIIGILTAVLIGALATVIFMSIAFNLYGS